MSTDVLMRSPTTNIHVSIFLPDWVIIFFITKAHRLTFFTQVSADCYHYSQTYLSDAKPVLTVVMMAVFLVRSKRLLAKDAAQWCSRLVMACGHVLSHCLLVIRQILPTVRAEVSAVQQHIMGCITTSTSTNQHSTYSHAHTNLNFYALHKHKNVKLSWPELLAN
jgi:hypothetical protein